MWKREAEEEARVMLCERDSTRPESPTCRPPALVRGCEELPAHQEVSGGQASKASSVFTIAPQHSHYCLRSAPVGSEVPLASRSSTKPTVNFTP